MKKSIFLCALQPSLAMCAFSALAVDSYPVELVGVNHTPMNFQIPQIKADLGSNIGVEGNVSRFTIHDEDQLKRVLSDFEQLLFLHKFENAIELFHAADYDDFLQSLHGDSSAQALDDQLSKRESMADDKGLLDQGQIDAQVAADAAAAEKLAADKVATDAAAAEKLAADKVATDAAAAEKLAADKVATDAAAAEKKAKKK